MDWWLPTPDWSSNGYGKAFVVEAMSLILVYVWGGLW